MDEKFKTLEEKFDYYTLRAIYLKEKGDNTGYLFNLKIALDTLEHIEGKPIDEILEEEDLEEK